MNNRSPNCIPSPKFSNGTPTRNHHFSHRQRQPLHLPPNSLFMSPRSNRTPSPRPSGGSPDFIPLGISSPVNRARQNWNRGSYSNNSSYSTYSTSSTPSSYNSSHSYSPYNRRGSRRRFRGSDSFNHNGNSWSGTPPIHLYYDKEALEDPWADLEKKMEKQQSPGVGRIVTDNEEKVLLKSSASESSNEDES